MAKHLETEMEHLKRKLLSLSTLVEDVVQKAVRSLAEGNKELAKEVLKSDNEIDNLEVEIEEDCLKILALHQPVAVDLRYLVGVLKVNNDLERIGDIAVNIAERALFIAKEPAIERPIDLTEMANKTYSMLKRAIDSLITMDSQKAKQVCQDDQEVDDLNAQMYAVIYQKIKESPNDVKTLINYLAGSRHLERIADYTTNISEDVIYMVDGTIVRHSPELYE